MLYLPQLIHPRIKGLFSKEIPPNLKLAGGLNYSLMNWKKLTQDQGILWVQDIKSQSR